MNSLDKFRSKVSAKQTELILRKLVKKQEDGEIRSDEELRKELATQIGAVTGGGLITLEIPVLPWNMVESERFKTFFDDLGMDIEVLFIEVDSTEEILAGLANNVESHLRGLQFEIGNLRSEIIRRRLRRPPGSGWSTIQRDSFDSGYGKLLDRAELSVDLFYDDRTGYSQNTENIPIKSDARIEGTAKKLTLPETGNTVIGFKQARLLWENGTTQGDIVIENSIEPYKIIDGGLDTFWSHTIGSEYPLLGTPTAEAIQIAGSTLENNSITVNISGLKDPQSHDYYFRIVGFSGTFPQYACMATTEDFTGPICKSDRDGHCQWNYTNQYSNNCVNRNCSRYFPDLLVISGGVGVLEDGYKYDTGAQLVFQNLSGLYAGQTWRIPVSSSENIGAKIVLELMLSKPTKINWIELEPMVSSPFQITSVEYTRQGDTTREQIISGEIQVLDRIRLDFKSIEADRIYLTLLQETYDIADLNLRPKQQAIQKIDDFITRINKPSIEEFYNVEIESILADFLPNGILSRMLENQTTKPQEVAGYFYTFGLFEVNCGLTSYADTAIAVAQDLRVVTPRVFGVQANLEPDIVYASGIESGQNGTIEFSAVKFNYDKNNVLINIDDFPVPFLSSERTITERLFIDRNKIGNLRFASKLISSVEIVSNSKTLSTSEYEAKEVYVPMLKTQITILDPAVVNDSIILVTYTPAFGISLNEARTLSIEDNRTQLLSLSEVPGLVVSAAKSANREIQYADVYLRVILRRNDLDIYGSPGLRDYQFLISESDEGRFF